MEDYEEVLILSTEEQIKEFVESNMWTDIKNKLNVWLEGVRDDLENTDTDDKDLFRAQGRAQAMRYILSLPEAMLEGLTAQREDQAKKMEERYERFE